jgi:four helix bundle protein
MEMADEIWKIVIQWDYFSKDTIGKQLVKAADSVSANLSEGFGRFYYKEEKQYCYYSRGSLSETKTWLTKANNRNLISDEDFNRYSELIKDMGIKLNNYISAIGRIQKTTE